MNVMKKAGVLKSLTESLASMSIVSLVCLSFHLRKSVRHSFRRTSLPGCSKQCSEVWFNRLRLFTFPLWSVSRCLRTKPTIDFAIFVSVKSHDSPTTKPLIPTELIDSHIHASRSSSGSFFIDIFLPRSLDSNALSRKQKGQADEKLNRQLI